jgi:hypothetical protein
MSQLRLWEINYKDFKCTNCEERYEEWMYDSEEEEDSTKIKILYPIDQNATDVYEMIQEAYDEGPLAAWRKRSEERAAKQMAVK